MRAKPLLSINVASKKAGVSPTTFSVFAAGHLSAISHQSIAGLYNSPIKREDPRMKTTEKDVDSRLGYDPMSVLLGFLGNDFGNPVAMINIVKLVLCDIVREFPSTHQELTGDESFVTTRPSEANVWVCPWVVVEESVSGQGYRGDFHGQRKSLSQLMVMAVAEEAKKTDKVGDVIAFTRPFRAGDYLLNKVGKCSLKPCPGSRLVGVWKGDVFYNIDQQGISNGEQYLLFWDNYYSLKDNDGESRLWDTVLGMHLSNGAAPLFVRPHGQIYDLPSLGVRMGFAYHLNGA